MKTMPMAFHSTDDAQGIPSGTCKGTVECVYEGLMEWTVQKGIPAWISTAEP
jgi:hypothetical protein